MAQDDQSIAWTKLKNIDPKAAQWLAAFWFTKCHIELHGYWKTLEESLENRHKLNLTSNPKIVSDKKELSEILKWIRETRAKEEVLMFQCFCYDHAPEIKSMIEMRLDLATSGKSTTMGETSPASAEANKVKSTAPGEIPPASTEANEIKSRLEELRQLREKYLKSQEAELPKAITDP